MHCAEDIIWAARFDLAHRIKRQYVIKSLEWTLNRFQIDDPRRLAKFIVELKEG